MRILFVLVALFTLAGCESMEFVAVDYHSGYNYGPYVRPVNHISYTLGYYSGSYYNGYRVYGTLGHRYYHAPRYYSHHRHFARPPVVHYHVHASYCEHNYRPRNRNNNRNSYVQPQVRNTPQATPPRQIQPRNTRNDNRRRDVTPQRREPTRVVPQRTQPTRVVPQRTQPTRVVPQQPRTSQATPSQNNRRAERGERRRDQNKKRK